MQIFFLFDTSQSACSYHRNWYGLIKPVLHLHFTFLRLKLMEVIIFLKAIKRHTKAEPNTCCFSWKICEFSHSNFNESKQYTFALWKIANVFNTRFTRGAKSNNFVALDDVYISFWSIINQCLNSGYTLRTEIWAFLSKKCLVFGFNGKRGDFMVVNRIISTDTCNINMA